MPLFGLVNFIGVIPTYSSSKNTDALAGVVVREIKFSSSSSEYLISVLLLLSTEYLTFSSLYPCFLRVISLLDLSRLIVIGVTPSSMLFRRTIALVGFEDICNGLSIFFKIIGINNSSVYFFISISDLYVK